LTMLFWVSKGKNISLTFLYNVNEIEIFRNFVVRLLVIRTANM
jgi:hypothetical protein